MIRLAGYEPGRRHRDRDHRARGPARSSTRSSSTPTSARSRPPPTGSCAPSARRRSTRTGSRRRSRGSSRWLPRATRPGLAEHVVELMARRGHGAPYARLIGIALPRCISHMTDLIDRIGPYLGIAAFLGLAILAFLIIQQAREVRRLREWAGRAPERATEAADATAAARRPAARRPPRPRPRRAPEPGRAVVPRGRRRRARRPL